MIETFILPLNKNECMDLKTQITITVYEDGRYIYNLQNIKICEIIIIDGKIHGKYILNNSDGLPIESSYYNHGLLVHESKSHDNRRVNYLNNKKNGNVFVQNLDDGPDTLYYYYGKPIDKFKMINDNEWKSNESLIRCNKQKNKWIGDFKLFDNDGNIVIDAYYNENGMKDGRYQSWYNTNQLYSESYYRNGKKRGLQKYYYSDGATSIMDSMDNANKNKILEIMDNSLDANKLIELVYYHHNGQKYKNETIYPIYKQLKKERIESWYKLFQNCPNTLNKIHMSIYHMLPNELKMIVLSFLISL
jgi:hypothetical protein